MDFDEKSVEVTGSDGIERARRLVRQCAQEAGLQQEAIEELVLATSELATNLSRYAIRGRMSCDVFEDALHASVEVRFLDDGPGIPDLERAMEDGFSTSGGLGRGLSSVERLTDELLIESTPEATAVRIRKWLPRS